MAEAQLIEFGETIRLHIAPGNDVDWFRFSGDAGDLFLLSAEADDSESLDTVIVYYDENGAEIGLNDDYTRVESIAPDSRFYSGVPTDGTYYFSLQDRATWANDPAGAAGTGNDREYDLTLVEVGGDSNVLDVAEPNDELADAVVWEVIEFSRNYTAGGFSDPAGDRDWIRIPVTSSEVLRLYGFPDSGGAGTTRVTVYMPDGTTPIQTYDGLTWETEHRAWIPVLETGTYFLEVQDSEAGGGFDHWYFLHAAKDLVEDGYPVEVEPNNDAATATVLPLTLDAGETVADADVWGRIGAAGDEDHYRISAEAGDQVTVFFSDTSHGETTNPQVHLVDPTGTAQAPIPWDHSEKPVISLESLSAGDWSLVVSETSAEVGAANAYYHLTVTLLRSS